MKRNYCRYWDKQKRESCFSTILFISATEPNHNTPTEHFLHCKDVMEGGWKNRHITNVTLVKGAKVSPCVWINNHFCVLATNSSDGSLPRKGIDRFPMSCRTPAGAPLLGDELMKGTKRKSFHFPKFQKHFWDNSVLIQNFLSLVRKDILAESGGGHCSGGLSGFANKMS